jgi:hypothetical protein
MTDVVGSLLPFLFIGITVACISWTVTHEEVFREPREFCVRNSKSGRTLAQRKFFYLFTCEYCFSHYVTALLLIITKFQLLFDDWRGYLIAEFSLVWLANTLMSLYALIKVDIKAEKTEISLKEEQLKG